MTHIKSSFHKSNSNSLSELEAVFVSSSNVEDIALFLNSSAFCFLDAAINAVKSTDLPVLILIASSKANCIISGSSLTNDSLECKDVIDFIYC